MFKGIHELQKENKIKIYIILEDFKEELQEET